MNIRIFSVLKIAFKKMKKNNISSGTQITYKNKSYYYDSPGTTEGEHIVYYFVPNWPFPKRKKLDRDQFTITKLKNKLDKLIDLEEALF